MHKNCATKMDLGFSDYVGNLNIQTSKFLLFPDYNTGLLI